MDIFTYAIVQIIVAVILLAVSYAITASMARRAPSKKPAALEAFEIPQDAEGTPQAVVFGQVWLTGWTVLWFGNYRSQPIRKKGGKK